MAYRISEIRRTERLFNSIRKLGGATRDEDYEEKACFGSLEYSAAPPDISKDPEKEPEKDGS